MTAAWCVAPPAFHTNSTTGGKGGGGGPGGCPAPSLHQGREQGPPSWGGLLLATACRGRPQPLACPPGESQWDFAQEAEGLVLHGAEPRWASPQALGFPPGGPASLPRPCRGLCALTSVRPARAALQLQFFHRKTGVLTPSLLRACNSLPNAANVLR